MLIILEGPDGAGKSTLARRLILRLTTSLEPELRLAHNVLLHARPPKEHPLEEYETPLLAYRPGVSENVICDRWHIGEAVYPSVLGRPSQWDRAVSQHITAFLASRGAVIVYLEQPVALLTEWITDRGGDDLVKVHQLHDVTTAYHRVLTDERVLPVLRLHGVPSNGELDLIINLAREHEKRTTFLNPFVTYVGVTHPKILILGEDRNRPPHELAPAFQPYPATSGHFMLRHLNLTSPHIGVANACDVDDPLALWRLLDNPRVVTLGTAAHRRMDRLGIPHAPAPHPQFVRRFHHRHGATYADVILEAGTTGRSAATWRP